MSSSQTRNHKGGNGKIKKEPVQDIIDFENKIDLLTEELRRKDEELEIQKEELRAQNEELAIQREELESQNEELKTNNEELDNEITEHKQADEALLASEGKFRNLFERMAQGVVYQDTNGKIISANPAAERILGLSFDQMREIMSVDPRWRAIHEDGSDFPGATHPAMIALKTCERNRQVMGVFHPSEMDYRWILVNATPEFMPGEERPYRVFTTFEDITERKKAEEVSAFHARLLSEVYDAVFSSDSNFTITYWNEAAERVFGWTKEEVLGKNSGELLKPKVEDSSRDKERSKLWSEGHWEGVVQYLRKDGTYFYAEVNSTLRKDANGKGIGNVIVARDITERKQTEEKIKQLNNDLNRRVTELQTLFEVLPISISISEDVECKHMYANKVFEDLVRMPAGSNISQSAPADEKPSFKAFLNGREIPTEELPMQKAAATGKPLHGSSFDAVCADGRVINFYGHAVPLFDEEGKVRGAIGVFDDMTERKRAEESLRASEEQFRKLFMSINEGFYLSRILYDDNGKPCDYRYIEVNPGFEKIMGMSRDQIIGKQFKELLPNYSVHWIEIFKRVALTGTPIDTEFYSDSLHRHFETIAYMPAEGQFAALLSDITERKQAESERERLLEKLEERSTALQNVNEELQVKGEELAAQAEEIESANEELRANNEELHSIAASLRETSDYLESLINYANAPIIVWDPQFIIIRFNHAFEQLSGYISNEVVGRHLSILFPRDSSEESLNQIAKTLAGEQWESVEIPIQHKYGGIRIALWNSANIYDGEKTLLATIAQGQDITERKRVESELSEAKDQAELYLDLMGHDISNLHQIMMMQLEIADEIMSTKGKLEANDKQLIEISTKTLERAARLVDNVRKLQKLRSGEYSLETIDLGSMLEDVMKVYSSIPGRDIKINFAPGDSCLVQANPLLKDVFINLVDNAVKHSSGPLEIGVDVHEVSLDVKSYYRVAIDDNGNGIPDDKKNEVFQRFKRGQTKARGTGLGLYLVKSLVEGFGGYVEVQNRVLRDYTKGTRFLVYLPVIKEEKNDG